MSDVERKIKSRIIEDIRPWGKFKQYTSNEVCTVKIITVSPDKKLSLQFHHDRDELWIAIDEGIRVQVGDDIFDPKPGDEIIIPRETKHRLSAVGRSARILEVSFGTFDEDDIVRLEDDFGRT